MKIASLLSVATMVAVMIPVVLAAVTKTCKTNEYMKQDGSCSKKPEDACPPGTHLVHDDEGGCFCLDCRCGACDNEGNSCCTPNAKGNNCNPNHQGNAPAFCNIQNNFFSFVTGSGDICGGVEMAAHKPYNGCGCKPNNLMSCTYSFDPSQSCFICTAEDLYEAYYEGPGSLCSGCLDCLATTQSWKDALVIAIGSYVDIETCLSRMSDEDRHHCRYPCTKS